ncbi:MAG: hypothetical protein ACRD1Z_10170, partial [Vicinamibacteria bacterium]
MTSGTPAFADRSHEIEGRIVTLPVEVRDATSASATFIVPSRAVRQILPSTLIDAAEIFPGRALC